MPVGEDGRGKTWDGMHVNKSIDVHRITGVETSV